MNKFTQILPQLAYSTKQVRENEVKVAAKLALPMFQLMLRAGEAAFALLVHQYPNAQSIAVICGKGNNGGDGFVLARLALQAGINVKVLLIADKNSIQGDAQTAMQQYIDLAGDMATIATEDDFKQCYQQCSPDIVVDALLGTGFKGDLSPLFAQIIEFINQQHYQQHNAVLSIDIPSGLNADTGAITNTAINADSTITFIALKKGLLTGQAANYIGDLYFAGLAVEQSFAETTSSNIYVLQNNNKPNLPQRKPTSHKGDIGLLLAVGGGEGLPGAIRLASEAALRSGAALVSVCCAFQNQALVFNGRPELMLAPSNAELLAQSNVFHKAKTLLIGPGLGRSHWAEALFSLVSSDLKAQRRIQVVDADGLYFLAQQPNVSSQRVITPHPKEAAMLLNCTVAEIEQDRFAAVNKLVKIYGGICVLKGTGSLVCNGKETWINTSGNAGMASGGMGDVLSGIIAALSLQMADLFAAVKLAVYLHGNAADIIAKQQGQCGMLASDLFLPLQASINGKIIYS